MPTEIVHQQTPEEAELLRKREELAAVRAELAERELGLADLHAQLKSFEGRYLRQVGALYAELDEWEARIAELDDSLDTNPTTKQRAAEARKHADETHEATHGDASKTPDFKPSAELKSLFRDVAKRIHPDFAKDEAERLLRTKLMAQANEAYTQGDTEAIQRVLDEFGNSPESVEGEGIGAELIRLIRQIHQARKNISTIEQELGELRTSEIAQLKMNADAAVREGRDLLAELAATVHEQIADSRKRHETLTTELKRHGR